MRAVQAATLEDEILEALRGYQAEVDQEPDYPTRVGKARELWKARCANTVFSKIRDLLRQMCCQKQCMYCEGSVANHLEHFWPKTFYPGSAFSWVNYLFICSPCNLTKLDGFAIFSSSSGNRVDIRRKRGEPVRQPEGGRPLLINPRDENPLDFLIIDLQETGTFLPRSAAGTEDWIRAEYTATELLDLNSASHRTARKNAYQAFRRALGEYVQVRNAGGASNRCVDFIRESRHPGVWAAMKRDRELIPELGRLFEAAPEALNW